MDNLWKIAKERGRIAPSHHGRAGPVCCGSSLGLLRLRKGGAEGRLSVEKWCPPSADVFTSYPRGGHGERFLFLTIVLSAYYSSGYMHSAKLLACN